TPLALALAQSGAERLVIVDDDVVDLSNLQRQVLYRTAEVGQPKVLALRDALARRGFTRVEPVRARFDESSASALLHDADVVCEGSDDLGTKFFASDAAVALGRPIVVCGVLRHAGLVFPVRPGRDACYRCLFEDPPLDAATCSEAGVFGATCGEVAALMARAALALASGADPHGVLGRVWQLEPAGRRSFTIRPRVDCAGCGAQAQEAVS